LISATTALCEQGLADPRGCDYRSITIKLGSVWGNQAQELKTRGWVMPVVGGAKPTHAIAWSGLLYPLVNAGEPADLDADVRALEEAAARANDALNRQGQQVRFNAFRTNNEASAVDAASLHPIKVCLLLRLGRADLAESVWAAGTGRPKEAKKPADARPRLDLNTYGVSYLTLATDLAWYRFDRAICAHMRGDDALALADLRALDGFALAADKQAEAMGFPRPERQAPPGQVVPYFEFLNQLPEFREDQERRARERANPPAPIRGEGRQARIAGLIRDLDQIAARQWGQPGGVTLGQSPIIQKLIAEGDAAVDPLIKAFRTEDRLTRSVGFHRDFFRNRHILSADQAAYTALIGLLKTTNFAPAEPNAPAPGRGPGRISREELANQMQAYWDKNRAIPVVERWYQTLADDEAGDAAWLEAAGNIVQPENERTVPGTGPFVMTETKPLKPGEKPRLRGEPLRRNHEPSVAALMARRADSMLKTPEGQQFELRDPCRMGAILAAWDPVAGLPTLRELTRICRQRYGRADNPHDWTFQNLAASIAHFTVARLEAGDAQAARDYAEFIRTTAPDRLEHQVLAVLEPFHRRPDDPTLAAAAAWLFGDPQSPWVPLIGRKGVRLTYHVAEVIASPMVEVPAFRRMLLSALDDRSVIGTARSGGQGSVSLDVPDGFSMGLGALKDNRDPPAEGTEMRLRMCDLYALKLASLPDAPAFNPCWPEPRRAAALAAMAEFLRKKGAR
jgi:hypothetical protein